MDSENEMGAGNHSYLSFIAGCVFRHLWRAMIGLNNSFFDMITSLVSLEHGVYGWEKVTSQCETRSKDLA
jgi:hypothetical protein